MYNRTLFFPHLLDDGFLSPNMVSLSPFTPALNSLPVLLRGYAYNYFSSCLRCLCTAHILFFTCLTFLNFLGGYHYYPSQDLQMLLPNLFPAYLYAFSSVFDFSLMFLLCISLALAGSIVNYPFFSTGYLQSEYYFLGFPNKYCVNHSQEHWH